MVLSYQRVRDAFDSTDYDCHVVGRDIGKNRGHCLVVGHMG
jgi:hypothetical protein